MDQTTKRIIREAVAMHGTAPVLEAVVAELSYQQEAHCNEISDDWASALASDEQLIATIAKSVTALPSMKLETTDA